MRRLLLLTAISLCGCGDAAPSEQAVRETGEWRDAAGHDHLIPTFRIDVTTEGSILWDGRPVTEAELAGLLTPAEPMNPEPAIDLHFSEGVAAVREEAIMRLLARSPFKSVAVYRGERLVRPAAR